MRVVKVSVVVVAAIVAGALVWGFLLDPAQQSAHGDDQYRTSSLAIAPWTPPVGAQVTAVIANVTSTDSNDASAHVTLYVTLPGAVESEWDGCDFPRVSGQSAFAELSSPLSNFTSGSRNSNS